MTALLTLERCMMPVLLTLFDSPKRWEYATEMLTKQLPTILAPIDAITQAGALTLPRTERLAHAALRVLLRVIHSPGEQRPETTRAWRKHVARLFGARGFFGGLTGSTLPLWAAVVNAWLGLETPKAATALLLSGKFSAPAGLFASRAAGADAHADLLRRLSFALWAGEHNQYVGALQGMLLERLVAGFKFGLGAGVGPRAAAVGWVVQAQALLCVRVLAVRVAPEHLTALWPIAMAELQRVLLAPATAPPPLLLAACQLIDTLLCVLPDDFSSFGWMFVPAAPVAGGGAAAAGASADFAALLAPLARMEPAGDAAADAGDAADAAAAAPPPSRGLLRPSADGRRRPLLGLRKIESAADLAPFASELHNHLARSALQRARRRGRPADGRSADRLRVPRAAPRARGARDGVGVGGE